MLGIFYQTIQYAGSSCSSTNWSTNYPDWYLCFSRASTSLPAGDLVQGDAGGPLVVEENGVEYLAGVVTGKMGNSASDPALAVSMYNFADWVRYQTEELCLPPTPTNSTTIPAMIVITEATQLTK